MNIDEAIKKISRGTTEIINREGLEAKLHKSAKTKKPLHIKAGFDPTAPDLHLGHLVLLRKLRQFQDLGHLAILIIGDFTARIGDPSGKETARKPLKEAEIKQNTK